MDGIGDGDDVALEQAAGVGVGQHDRGDLRRQALAHLLGIDGAVGAGRNLLDAVAERAAVAGLVPWADAGTSTTERRSPRASSAALIAIMPQSSPWAPAFGLTATVAIPVSSSSQRPSSAMSSKAPGTVEAGWSG